VKVFFDTSVLVAALTRAHPHHARALVWVEACGESIEGLVSWHGLAELWSVLTRLPVSPPVPSALAERMVKRVQAKLKTVNVSVRAYRQSLKRCSERGLRSGAVFDALHLLTAEEAGADLLVTFNAEDFERLAAGARPPIVVPPDPPRIALP
jgi:predicted nucleic acid-binding protein